MSSSHRQSKKASKFRWLILLPAIFFTFADRASAETYPLECREVDVEWTDEPVWWCKRYWYTHDSRITDEQRETFTVIATTMLLVNGRLRRR